MPMDYHLFLELIIISGFAIPAVLIFQKFKIPIIVGFLLAGVIINPHFGIFKFMDIERVNVISEFGVACLLFSIGLEFSFQRIKEIKIPFAVGGTAQVVFTIILTSLVCLWAFGKTMTQSIFLGCVVAASCTALVFSLIQKRGDSALPYAKISQAILIYQDFFAILMVIFLPLLSGAKMEQSFVQIFLSILLNLVVIAVVGFVFYKWIIPKGLYYVAKTQSRELFVMTIIFIFLFFVALSAYLEISIVLGAFIAGVLISESPYNHRAMGVILPFKDIFTSIFFVSTGITLELHFVIMHFPLVILLTIAMMLLKFTTAVAAVLVLKRPLSVALMTGAALAQVGEFSFVLIHMGNKLSMISNNGMNFLLGASVLTIIFTPFLMNVMPVFTRFIMKALYSVGLKIESPLDPYSRDGLNNHVVIVGYGIIGRRVAMGARMAGLKYCIIEANPDTVKRESAKGVPIFYGDASQEAILEHARVDKAAIVAVTIPGTESALLIAEAVRRMNSEANLLVRTRFEATSVELMDIGANQVFVEEKEISIEMLATVLRLSLVSMQDIEHILVAQVSEDTDMLEERAGLDEFNKAASANEITVVKLAPSSCIAGQTLSGVDFRRKYGLSVIMIRRGNAEFLNPSPDEKLFSGDRLVVVGPRDKLSPLVDDCRGKEAVPDGLPAVVAHNVLGG